MRLFTAMRSGLKAAIKAYYEAGQPSTRRRYLPRNFSDARFDANPGVLREIREASKYHECNSPICNRIAGVYEQFTVGPFGMPVEPGTADTEYGAAQRAYWEWWGQYCQVGSREPVGNAQILSARTRFYDGECFVRKTKRRPPDGAYAYYPSIKPTEFIPAIQLIETHRVSNPPSKQVGPDVDNGIELDSDGNPIAYYVRRTDKEWDRVPAAEMVHIVKIRRVGLKHGLPLTTPCLVALNDLQDLQQAEMDAAKENARVAKVVFNSTGEPTVDELNEVSSSASYPDTANPSRKEYLEKAWGGETHFLKKDVEDYKQYGGERPTVTTINFWDYMLAQICAGMGMSKLLVLPFTLQGTVTRMDLDIADAFFWSEFAVYKTAWEEVWRWVQLKAQESQPSLRKPPEDWAQCSAAKPKSVNVDIKRNSQAAMAEIEKGGMTWREWFAENGQDWRKELAQRGIEIEFEKEQGIRPKDKVDVDKYGIGVRAGVITPNLTDEQFVRKNIGLPDPSDAVQKAWQEEGGARKPITLSSAKETQNAIQEGSQPTEEA